MLGKLTMAEAARKAGITPHNLKHRLARGWPLKLALSVPVKVGNRLSWFSKEHKHGRRTISR